MYTQKVTHKEMQNPTDNDVKSISNKDNNYCICLLTDFLCRSRLKKSVIVNLET